MNMELSRVESLLKTYFEGNTSLTEEKELQLYFSSPNIDVHLVKYQPIFTFLAGAKEVQFTKQVSEFKNAKRKTGVSKFIIYAVSIAASVIVSVGLGNYFFFESKSLKNAEDLGTFEDPRAALAATQKALSLLSSNLNVGINNVQQIDEYQKTKDKIFKRTSSKNEEL
ncbi:hypothetical protein SAMN05444396_101321 [Flavobacterium segetis]|uniref:Uncharacterized protein n=2 Tax=Flavobacterium segetis TaxID=271157 RepID=A0A1M5EDV5_9FLAO|nr:hypothetical protein SAMN05444396_101321 [Flavobacterium segetis]